MVSLVYPATHCDEADVEKWHVKKINTIILERCLQEIEIKGRRRSGFMDGLLYLFFK